MKPYVVVAAIAACVAAVWGYYADLQHGDVGWFVGRIVVVTLITASIARLLGARSR